MATGTLTQRDREKVSAEQLRAWAFYGLPRGSTQGSESNRATRAVGEVRYVIGWLADQMTRMQWRVTINGSEDWRVTTPAGEVISPAATLGEDGEPDVAAASEKLLDLVGWSADTVRQVTTNLFVAGELEYVAAEKPDGDEWSVVSVIHHDRRHLLDSAVYRVGGLWPHPADPKCPDAPLFGVLEALEELDWLSRLSRSQSASRIAMRGVLGVADGMAFAGGGDFWEEWNAAVRGAMADPTDVSPLVLRGPAELIEGGNKNGFKGLGWAIPDFPYDARIDERVDKLIHRIAYGLPVPPEILLGMQAQSRATAYQVEENSYRAHIEPPAKLVASVPQKALSLVLSEVGEVEVVPDPSILLARRHSVQDVKDAFDRGAVSYDYLREVLAIPQDSAATAADVAFRQAWDGSTETVVGERDPANSAADEGQSSAAASGAVVASVGSREDKPLDAEQLERLSAQLVEIDYAARLELSGATALAVDRAREKIGALARSQDRLRSQLERNVPNSQVPSALGSDALTGAGVPIDEAIAGATRPLGGWWATRVRESYAQVTGLLGEDAAPAWSDADVEASVALLSSLLSAWITTTLDSASVQPLPYDHLRLVLAVAGGDQVPADVVPVVAKAGGDELATVTGGIATGVRVGDALESVGVMQTEWRWLWRPGDAGGTFDPHLQLNGRHAPAIRDFGYEPGGYPNGRHCRCDVLPIYRDERGRFRRDPDAA